ncbi:Regulatory protein rop (plasmid) [Klebsiella pneumoniae]|uniref:Rop protein n=1 Tax=Klebsiella pneumoniae TaxID=573 RepID=A0A218N507_KLEPN|nr:Regulatory protein ROP [Klebsiella pneumoniae 30660/NJST258_1]ASF81261.1 rop protein [Klebsiella pneumoniae]EFJ79582.1 rop protein [Escherichia coli MS 69-1]ESE24898.1 rop protein [Escherichia coli 908691]KXA03151.1 rop protein [Citrobacter koseri]KXH01082.1 rop protein [Escherichia coli]
MSHPAIFETVYLTGAHHARKERIMTKQEKTALNMAKFIKEQSLLLLDKLNELDMDTPADMCERLHEDAETLWQVMRDKLGEE